MIDKSDSLNNAIYRVVFKLNFLKYDWILLKKY
jgi:hypothetical protein